MLGATGVGKTSLVRRFVESLFSERYLATIGVKIDRRLVELDGDQVSLLLWDLQGEDEFARVRLSYLRGASGLIYVADGTRPETLDTARSIQTGAIQSFGAIPSILFVNKCDLAGSSSADEATVAARGPVGVDVFRSSAKEGTNVEAGFERLVRAMGAAA
jgi:small GTP-binding protein